LRQINSRMAGHEADEAAKKLEQESCKAAIVKEMEGIGAATYLNTRAHLMPEFPELFRDWTSCRTTGVPTPAVIARRLKDETQMCKKCKKYGNHVSTERWCPATVTAVKRGRTLEQGQAKKSDITEQPSSKKAKAVGEVSPQLPLFFTSRS
jgi:hypothetical protein